MAATRASTGIDGVREGGATQGQELSKAQGPPRGTEEPCGWFSTIHNHESNIAHQANKAATLRVVLQGSQKSFARFQEPSWPPVPGSATHLSNNFICTGPDPGQGKTLPCTCSRFLERLLERSKNHGGFFCLLLPGPALPQSGPDKVALICILSVATSAPAVCSRPELTGTTSELPRGLTVTGCQPEGCLVARPPGRRVAWPTARLPGRRRPPGRPPGIPGSPLAASGSLPPSFCSSLLLLLLLLPPLCSSSSLFLSCLAAQAARPPATVAQPVSETDLADYAAGSDNPTRIATEIIHHTNAIARPRGQVGN